MHTLQRALAIAVVAAAIFWLFRTAPDNTAAILRAYHVVIPVTLVLGVAGLIKAWIDWQHGKRDRDLEGLAVVSFFALAWGHLGLLLAIRRGISQMGYSTYSLGRADYHVGAGIALVIAVLLVLRWATRHEVEGRWPWPQYLSPALAGELPWATFAVAWMIFIAAQQDVFSRLLIWAYSLMI